MDASMIKIDGEQKKVALSSITNSRDGVEWKLNNESKYLEEYKAQYENQQKKVDLLIKELKVLNELIDALGGSLPPELEIPSSGNQPPNEEITVKVEAVKGEFVEPHTRVQYPSSPKEKLKELVLSGSKFKTDDQLRGELQIAFNIAEIPKKTVVNYLLELKAEKVIKRVKSIHYGTSFNGSPEWVNEEGIPLKEFWVD